MKRGVNPAGFNQALKRLIRMERLMSSSAVQLMRRLNFCTDVGRRPLTFRLLFSRIHCVCERVRSKRVITSFNNRAMRSFSQQGAVFTMTGGSLFS